MGAQDTPDAAERRARALLDGHSLARDAAPDLARDVLSLADALATAEASIAQLRADLERADHERQRVESERDAMEDDRDAARSALDGLVAAVAGERERAVAVCRAVADGWERASTTAKVDTGLALIRAEGATECADAIAAPTGGGE